MDGHERQDVVDYWNKNFLPAIKEFEKRMLKFEGPEMKRIDPELEEGQQQIIAFYHDECCFHAWDESNSAWLRKDEQPLRKKGRGRLIHVSDFILEDTGQLVCHEKDGSIVEDTRKIIYPSANGDPWWDCNQLLVQLKSAIEIFD